MKRYGYLYEKIYDLDNLRLAHKNAQKGKKHYKEVKKINKDQDKYLLQIQEMLKNKTYRTSKYTIFSKRCDDKDRVIYKLPYFPDRIVHHAILQVLEPIWKKTFIETTYSSIKGRGIHKAVDKIKNDIKNNDVKYCLKLDISKFYPSVDHNILKNIIGKKIKDKDVLSLLYSIIDSAPGIPIGNYLSQFLGNLYLTYLDHAMKEKYKCKYYYRYCDDIVIFCDNKEKLHFLLNEIKIYLEKELNLKLKNNYQIFPLSKRGLDFLGYVFYKTHTKVRKKIKERFIQSVSYIKKNYESINKKHIVNSIMSYYGWLKHSNSKHLWDSHIDNSIISLLEKSGLKRRLI